MANYKLKLDLAKLCGAQVVEVQGRKCIVLPIDDNGIFISQRGAAYLDLNVRESREVKYGQTHFVKVAVSKKAFAALSNEAKDALKNVVGNMSPDEYPAENSNTAYSTPTQATPPMAHEPESKKVDVDNLPF